MDFKKDNHKLFNTEQGGQTLLSFLVFRTVLSTQKVLNIC
jgi:hypothetical protein